MNIKAFTRFWSKVATREPHQCWLFGGGLDPDGYGIFSDANRRSIRAHRFAFICASGRAPKLAVLHRCNVRACCNPLHLYEGTAKDNHDDCVAAGNYKTVFVAGDQHPNAKLSDAQVAEMFDLIAMGHSQRAVAARFGVTPSAITYHARKRGIV
jgi:hypothetical protein